MTGENERARTADSAAKFLLRLLVMAFVPAAIIFLWHVCVVRDYLPRSIIPTPRETLRALIDLVSDGTIFRHIAVSLLRLAAGFVVGCTLGLSLASAVTLSVRARLLLRPTLAFLAPIPVVAWIPLFIVSLGIDGSKIGLIAAGTASLVYSFALTGFAETRQEYLEVARHYNKSRIQTFVQVVLPSAAYSLLGGMRVAMGLSWVLLIASELIASSSGLGWFIWDSRNFSRPGDMVAGMVVVAVLGLTADKLVHGVQEWLARWRPSFQGV